MMAKKNAAQPAPEPVWIQPDHLQKARIAPFLCRVEPFQRMADFVPLYAHPPAVTLPPLPEPTGQTDNERGYGLRHYTADQMRDYARECLRAAGVEIRDAD
jgi:hypothetical protein